jgi:subtilisin-like proprotein convertase family protein
MKRILALAFIVCSGLSAHAVLYSTNWTVGAAVPDNNLSGLANSQTVAASGTLNPGSLLVSVALTGGWNGDLYAYLVHGSGFAVLLDRVGPGTYGYSTAGMDVWLTDGAGVGNIDSTPAPFSASSAAPYSRTGYAGSLASFDGLNVNGTWTLFVADLSGGSVSTLQSWGLEMDIVAVPEVETWVAAVLAGLFGAYWLNRQVFGAKPDKGGA